MAAKSPYSPELRRRAVRMVGEVRPQYPTEWAAISAVAEKLGIGTAETLRTWVRKAEADTGEQPTGNGGESEESKRLKRENAELRRANDILKAASDYFARELDLKLPRYAAVESPNSLYKRELIDFHESREGVMDVTIAIMEWVGGITVSGSTRTAAEFFQKSPELHAG